MQVLQPAGWPRPRGYANGVRVPAGRDLVLVAGMIGWDAQERLVAADLPGQLAQALRNLLAVVAEAGGGPTDVVAATIFVTDIDAYRSDTARIGLAWREVMGRHFPALAVVGVAALVDPGALVEVQALAAVPPAAGAGGA